MRFLDTLAALERRYGIDACWAWPGYTDKHGRGRTHRPAHLLPGCRIILVHQRAYLELVGPIPPGTELDHLCCNMGCVNPYHCEPVSRQENLARSDGPSALHARAEVCKYGHPFTPENTLHPYSRHPAWRRCRTCAIRLAGEAQKRHRKERNAYKREWKRRRKRHGQTL